MRPGVAAAVGIVALALACGAAAGDGTAKGSLTYPSKSGAITVAPRHAYFVKGPDAVDNSVVIRRLIISTSDLGAKIAACSTMSCADANVAEGMSVDLAAGPRLNYWIALNSQRIQYSGTVRPAALALTTETPARLAGKLAFDDSAAGGPRVEIEFDAPLLKELKQAR